MKPRNAGTKTGPMRIGPFRLDMPEFNPSEERTVTWLRDMVTRRREENVPHHGAVYPGEEKTFRSKLRKSIIEEAS